MCLGATFGDSRQSFSINEYRQSKGFSSIPEHIIANPAKNLRQYIAQRPVATLPVLQYAIDNVPTRYVDFEPQKKRMCYTIPTALSVPLEFRPGSLLKKLSRSSGNKY